MLNRKPYDLKLIIGAYNLLQVVLCVIILNYVSTLLSRSRRHMLFTCVSTRSAGL